MEAQKQSLVYSVKRNILCLALLLSLANLVSSQRNYYVDPLADTRKALLTYSTDPSSRSAASSPSNNFLTNVEEIEKTVYDGQALSAFYPQTAARRKKIEGIIQLAAKHGNSQFIRQALGHALYITFDIEKKKSASSSGRKKRSISTKTVIAMKRVMKSIQTKMGKKKFEKFIGNKNKDHATLTFAIDDTGSMYREIDAVKDIAKYIVNQPRPNLEVDYILSPFNDPETGRAIKKEAGKGTEFINQLQALYAHGGGDCAEPAFTGIIEALKKQPVDDSPLYVFTDAPPKDASLLNSTIRQATMAGIHVYFFVTVDCGNAVASKPFEDLARETCGQIFELPKSRSDLAKMKSFTKVLLDGTTCSGSFGGGMQPIRKKKRSVALTEYKLLVDDTMETVIVSVSSENSASNIELKDPLGAFVISGKTTISKVTVFEVDSPQPGIWKLVVPTGAGKHTYMFKGSSKTNLDFDFTFVIPRTKGSPIPVSHPLTGKYAYVILIVREARKVNASSLYLNILNEDGNVLHTTSVRPLGTSGAHFSAAFPTPTVSFKLQLRGKTNKNFDFERRSKIIIHPSHVVVKLLYTQNEFTVPKSDNESITFFAYNTGAPELFDFTVKDTSTFMAYYSRSPVRILQDRIVFFDVFFTAAPSAVPGTADTVVVTLTGRTTKVSVSSVVELMVA